VVLERTKITPDILREHIERRRERVAGRELAKATVSIWLVLHVSA
jgi:hypothetical protein